MLLDELVLLPQANLLAVPVRFEVALTGAALDGRLGSHVFQGFTLVHHRQSLAALQASDQLITIF